MKAKTITKITLQEAEYILRSTKGRVFSVDFYKKDGSERKLQGRLGVRIGITGKGSTMRNHSEYLTAYEMHNGYCNVNLNAIKAITFGGIRYEVTNDI